jgi:hypothetical protein
MPYGTFSIASSLRFAMHLVTIQRFPILVVSVRISMEFLNHTPFPSLAFQAIDQHNRHFHVVAMRVTYDIGQDGELRFAEKQDPLVVADQYFDEDGAGSIVQESDLAPYKPRCDVVVIGTAYSPGGVPLPGFLVRIRIVAAPRATPSPHYHTGVGAAMPPSGIVPAAILLDKKVIVTGPRYWKKGWLGWSLTKPQPITMLPLRYEYAFGGECRIEVGAKKARKVDLKYRLKAQDRLQHPEGHLSAPLAHTAYAPNPLGKGYTEEWHLAAKKVKAVPAPQIYSPDQLIIELHKQYAPQGFGVISKGWRPRSTLCGTVDDCFVQSEKVLPDDFDFGFWNCAHGDLQIPHLHGDEEITVTNLTWPGAPMTTRDAKGNALLRFNLPGHTPFVLVRCGNGAIIPLQPLLDTLIIRTDIFKVSSVHRLLVPVEPAVRVMEARLL